MPCSLPRLLPSTFLPGSLNASRSIATTQYGINWTPDTLEWTVDGVVTRTLNKADTLNTATGIYNYPSTPSRIQLSIWPGGIPSAPAGTIAWAGGLIDW